MFVVGIKVFSFGGMVYSGIKFVVCVIVEGLCYEVGGKICLIIILLGVVEFELKYGSLDI